MSPKFRDIFKWVLRTACTRPLTLVIDEFQDLRRCDPAIYSEMQREWDEFHTRAKINLIALYALSGGIAKYVALLMDHGAITRDQMIEDMVSEGSLFIGEGKAGLIEEFGKRDAVHFDEPDKL